MALPDPSLPGNWTHAPMPSVVMVNPNQQMVQYTDVNQFEWFVRWINYSNNNNCNVRLEPDGTTIRWFWAYYLPLGHYLYQGTSPMDEATMRFFFSPASEWPTDLSSLFHPDSAPGNDIPSDPEA